MYIVNHYPNLGATEVVEIQNPDNLELFINANTLDVWENNPFYNMRKIGISVITKTKEDYEKVQVFLTKKVAYIDWAPQMEHTETAIVLKANKNSDFSSGSVGSAEYQRSCGIVTLPFIENLSEYLIN